MATTPKLSVVYITFRRHPHLEWFVNSLHTQVSTGTGGITEGHIQLVIVDAQLWNADYAEERRREVRDIVGGRFADAFRHVPPKDNPWQGPARLTSKDYFVAGNARNTGAAYAIHGYLAFVDDTSVLLPTWLETVMRAARERRIVAGAYKKATQLEVGADGGVVSATTPAGCVDSRWGMGRDGEFVEISGGQLFGCSFGCPLDDYLEADGQDDYVEAAGGEDYIFGLRLENMGRKMYYARSMLTYELDNPYSKAAAAAAAPAEESVGDAAAAAPIAHLTRRDPRIDQAEYAALMRKHGITRRTNPKGNCDYTNFVLDYQKSGKRDRFGHKAEHSIRALRRLVETTGTIRLTFDPHMRSFDGVLLRDL